MLNARALGELLTNNRDERLCKRWFVMTPNGTLLAYSQPTEISELRRQATIAATSWQSHNGTLDDDEGRGGFEDHSGPEPTAENGGIPRGALRALTIESEEGNLLVRVLQSQLLLCLEGGVPPRRGYFETRVTIEGPDDEAYPLNTNGMDGDEDSAVASAASSTADSSASVASRGVLALQRKRLEAMAEEIVAEFERIGFKMPEDEGGRLF